MLACVCRIVAALAMVAASTAAVAQAIPPSAQPGRERERFTEPTAPRAEPRGPAISLPSTVAPEGAAKIKLVVTAVRITGSTVYTQEQLAPLYAGLLHQRVTLQAVYDLAQKITAKYGADGYVLSRAIVPPQELKPGGAVVRIEIVEGYVDKVEWPKALGKYVDFFSDYAAKIIADRPANIRTIERYLLLAGDLPGLKFKNSLKPSATHQGAATLIVEVTEKPLDAAARIDNRGSKAQGPLEYLGSVTANNLLRIHDAFTATYAGAFETRELQYFAGNYRQVLTSEGLTFFANASYGFGHPGTPELLLIDYATRSGLGEAGLSYPVIRARERNLTLGGLFFVSDNRSFQMGDLFTVDRLRGLRLKADGDMADSLHAINQVNFVFSQGIEGLGSTGNDNPIPSRANGRVDFSKVETTLTRMQPLPWGLSVLLSGYGQYGLTPLLSSEACGFGGRVFGRAFEPSQFLGDTCLEGLAELRYELPAGVLKFAPAQLYGFADRGFLHNIAPVPGSPVDVDAASVGGGLRLGWQNAFTADVSLAKAVQGPQEGWRVFFIVAGRY